MSIGDTVCKAVAEMEQSATGLRTAEGGEAMRPRCALTGCALARLDVLEGRPHVAVFVPRQLDHLTRKRQGAVFVGVEIAKADLAIICGPISSIRGHVHLPVDLSTKPPPATLGNATYCRTAECKNGLDFP